MANNKTALTATLGEAIRGWLYKHKKNSIKASSFDRLLVSHSLLMQHAIGHVRLMDLTTDAVQDFINQLVDENYSYNSIKKAYNLVSAYVRYAIGDGVPIAPVTLNATLPAECNVTAGRRDVEAYDEPAQARIRRVCDEVDNTAARAVVLLLETGMRIGELLALKWSDVQWSRRAVRIHATLGDLANRSKSYIQEGAKSKTSNRTIPLSTQAIAVLKRMMEEDDAAGLIFHAEGDAHTSIAYNPLANATKRLLKTAGVPWKGFHVFRHTFATNCYYRGCEIKILSKLLGHANVTITYNIYINLYGDALEEMRSIIN